MDKVNSAQLIVLARQKAGITQAQLAKRAGTSQPAVVRYESGQSSPSIATMTRLLRACGFDLDIRLKKARISDLSSVRAQKIRQHRGEVLKLAKKYGASNVRIFGSVVRGEDAPNSDLDLLVDIGEENNLWDVVQLETELEELLGIKVDVSPSRTLKSNVADTALREAIPL